jgi:hypothetical protein
VRRPLWREEGSVFCQSLSAVISQLRILQSYFMTGGSPPISSPWCQAPWGPRPEIFQLSPCDNSPYVTSSLTRRWVCLFCIFFRVKVTFRLTVSQSVSKSWCQATSGAHDQIFLTLWQLQPCFCGAPFVTRRRICLLYMLLSLAGAFFLGSESVGTRDHIFLSQIWDFPFVASYDSQGYGGGIRPRLHVPQ